MVLFSRFSRLFFEDRKSASKPCKVYVFCDHSDRGPCFSARFSEKQGISGETGHETGSLRTASRTNQSDMGIDFGLRVSCACAMAQFCRLWRSLSLGCGSETRFEVEFSHPIPSNSLFGFSPPTPGERALGRFSGERRAALPGEPNRMAGLLQANASGSTPPAAFRQRLLQRCAG